MIDLTDRDLKQRIAAGIAAYFNEALTHQAYTMVERGSDVERTAGWIAERVVQELLGGNPE